MASQQCHVIIFPWFAFGHMLPMLEFSKKLAARGIIVSFVTTLRNLKRLPPIPSNLADKIKMVEIKLPSVDGLPEECDATIDLQLEAQVQLLKKAYDQLAVPFEKLVQESLPDLIVIDFAAYRIAEVAAKFAVNTAFLSVYTAATLAYLGPPNELKSGNRRTQPEQFTRPPDWFTLPSLIAHRPDYAPRMLRNLHFPDASGVSSGQRFAKIIEQSQFVAVRSCKEFEGEYIQLLEKLYQKPVLPIGILPPVAHKNHMETDSSWSNTFKWLDIQNSKSVVFVGFGSEYKMPIEQVHELAFALELSGLPFIWIIRKPQGIETSQLFPPGFEIRTSNQGIVCLGWSPQMDILAHAAIGGCLFHSGWGSIIESLGFGHPLILMPMVADQGLNAKLLVEKGVGYEVPRREDGSFDRKAVAKAIGLVMVAQEGEAIRLKAAEMQNVFSDHNLHDSYIDKFIHHLQKVNILKFPK